MDHPQLEGRTYRDGVSLAALDRRARLHSAERELRIERLLLRKELCTDAGQLFLDRYGELISLSASGQLAMRRLFEQHLKRVEWDAWKFPIRLYPFLSAEAQRKSAQSPSTQESPLAGR